MNKHPLAVIIILLLLSTGLSKGYGQNVQVIKFSSLDSIISTPSKKTRIINFWATWCRPCVAELPQFTALENKYSSQNMELLLVSFDFVEDLEKKLIPFISKKNIKSKVLLLDETDYNAFIDQVDPSWSGAIPATLMIGPNLSKRLFLEKEFKKGELENTYLEFL